MRMSPHETSGASSCLDFIHYEESIMTMADDLQLLEVEGGSMVVSSFRLDRFNDHGSHRLFVFPLHNGFFSQSQTTCFFLCVLLLVVI